MAITRSPLAHARLPWLYSEVVPWQRQYPIRDLASPWISAANAGFLMREGPPLDPARMAATHWQRLALTAPRPLTVYRNQTCCRATVWYPMSVPRQPAEASVFFRHRSRTTAVVECPSAIPQPPGTGTVLVSNILRNA